MSALHAAASAAEMLPRVLSIQSHTVYGYVGNKAATFPLQLLGFEVDPLNTVLLSNHGGYPIVKGRGMGGPQLEELLEGLKLNKLLETYSYISSGYCRDASFLDVLADAVQTMKSKNPVKYHLDPVLGDDGKLYIPEECLTIYRERLLPLADVVTPNAFEAKLLTGIEIKTEQDAVKACKALHARGPRTVLITSVIAAEGKLKVIGSQMLNGTTGPGAEVEVYELELPMIEGSFTGCGDLFSAMLLANMHMHPDDFPTALELACSVVHRVVEITAKLAKAPAGAKPPTAPCPELQLVRCKDAIEDKVAHFRARAIRDKDEVLGVIFDMDGTLTEPGNIDFSAMRRRLGIPPSGDILADIQKMPESKQAEALQIVEEEELAALEKLVLQPGLTEVMLSLSRRRIKCAIATRNMGAAVDFFLDRAGLPHEIFAPIVTRDCLPYNKPDARVAHAIAQGWGIPEEQILFVGDHKDDILCGKSAGCGTILVKNHINEELALETDIVDKSITRLDQLLPIVRI